LDFHPIYGLQMGKEKDPSAIALHHFWKKVAGRAESAISTVELNRNVTPLSLFTRKLEVEHDLWCCLQRESNNFFIQYIMAYNSHMTLRWLAPFYLD